MPRLFFGRLDFPPRGNTLHVKEACSLWWTLWWLLSLKWWRIGTVIGAKGCSDIVWHRKRLRKGASSMQVGRASPLLHCPPGLSADVIHLRIQGPQIPFKGNQESSHGFFSADGTGLCLSSTGLCLSTHPRGVWLKSPVPAFGGRLDCAQCWVLNKSCQWRSIH